MPGEVAFQSGHLTGTWLLLRILVFCTTSLDAPPAQR
jgi:hypothetical protein